MKKIILMTAIICFFNVMGYANDNNQERNSDLFVDSYHYGLSGKDCSEIYSNFGTSKWTFNSNDAGDLDKLYKGCKVGEKDRIKGKKELPQVLDRIKNKQKTTLHEKHGNEAKK